jgi:hypothetical protein
MTASDAFFRLQVTEALRAPEVAVRLAALTTLRKLDRHGLCVNEVAALLTKADEETAVQVRWLVSSRSYR